MSENTFGKLFACTSFGESHGSAIGCVVDGCPPNLELSEADLERDLARRRPGRSRYTSQRRETDQPRILSGVFEGRTTGAPIAILIENTDQRSRDYEQLRSHLRPGHADYVYLHKYGRRDHRGGGRASARETAVRVAAGAIARKYLSECCGGIRISAWLSQLGSTQLGCPQPLAVDDNPFFCADPERIPELEEQLQSLIKAGDSVGAEVTVVARAVPPGLGAPLYGRLDAELAAALMGINAAKAVAIGDGFEVVAQRGSQHRDEMTPEGFCSNHAGGIVGGISTGQDIVARVAFKPTSSIRLPGRGIDVDGNAVEVVTTGRHDPCVGLRAVPVAEAMLAHLLMDHWLRHRAQNAEVSSSTPQLPAGESSR